MPEENVNFWKIKEEIRVLGVDDGPFEFGEGKEALIVGAVYRGGRCLDGVLTTMIEVDGNDATDRISEMILRSRHRGQVRIVMTDGLTFGGFNVMDGESVYERTGLPVISVTRSRPDMKSIEKALRNFSDFERRWERIQRAGEPTAHIYPDGRGKAKVFFQAFGIDEEDAHQIIEITSTHSLIPEPIRSAHMIASGLVKGESYGRV
jgi:hypothetical protein